MRSTGRGARIALWGSTLAAMIWSIALLGVCVGLGAGLLGAGSSFLTTLLLLDVARLPVASALPTSLVVVGATSVVALVPYSRARAVLWRVCAAFGAASTVGAFVGGRASGLLPPRALLVVFGVTMAVAAIAMLRGRPPRASARPRASPWLLAGAGLLLGGLTGLVGVGGGFAVLPLLVVWRGVPMREAVGTTLLVVVLNTLAGLAGHLPHPPVDWRLAGYLGCATMAGALAGAWLHARVRTTVLRRAFAVALLATAVGVALHAAVPWNT